MKLKIALEWFLNPDHLPMIAGIYGGKYAQEGLEVELIEPKEHYDGFKVLQNGEIDIHVNEPLHLFEHYFDGVKSLGCFFETRGGVMIRASSIEKLRNNQPIKITTPASNPITDKIGFEILARYALKNGFELSKESVAFIETDFYHLKNMRKGGYDGAWLCFYNFEGIEAKLSGFDNLFIDQFESPYPNFSALEMITTQEVLNKKGEAIRKFIKITSNMAQYLSKNPLEAKTIYYDYTKSSATALMDNIIIDTLPRLEPIIKSDASRWRELANFLEELELVKLSQEQYNNIWID
ncbi:MAG: ABC transporter substrate-binding protein [Epsilonproteobacteria bacterium]|nr:ABC transporter substrate-binding protein [Campylobacterota bacterium]